MSRRLRTSWWHRSLTALFAVWFVLATTEVTSLHACPMHDGPMAEMSAGGHDAGMSMADMSMAGMAMSSMDMSSANMSGHAGHTMPANESGSPTDHHSCTCISTCCAATTVALAATAKSLQIAAQYTSAEPVAATASASPRVLWIDFVLPFANAPPMITNA